MTASSVLFFFPIVSRAWASSYILSVHESKKAFAPVYMRAGVESSVATTNKNRSLALFPPLHRMGAIHVTNLII